MQKSKVETFIGFSIKSGKIIFGLDNIEKYHKKIHLIVLSNSISDNSKTKVLNIASKREIDVLELEDSLENITKRKNCKVLAITSFELANAIKNS